MLILDEFITCTFEKSSQQTYTGWFIWVATETHKTLHVDSQQPQSGPILVLFSLLSLSITTETFQVERRAAELLNAPAAFTLSFLCSAQRPKPQGGAAVRHWQGRSHSESPELFHFKSTHQSLLPGRGTSLGEGGQWQRRTSALLARVSWGCARAAKQTILQQVVSTGLEEVATWGAVTLLEDWVSGERGGPCISLETRQSFTCVER